jgi:hypothetical protein
MNIFIYFLLRISLPFLETVLLLYVFCHVVEFRSCLASIITMTYQAPTMCKVLLRYDHIYPFNNPQGLVISPDFMG